MNRNTPTHIGIDVSKARLDVHIPGQAHLQVANSARGLDDLFAAIAGVETPHLVCESTAGYQKLLAVTALQRGIPVSVVMPARVRYFALSGGILAKTDRIDARLIASYADTHRPPALVAPDPAAVVLRQMLEARRVLVDLITDTGNRLELAEGFLRKTLTKLRRATQRLLDQADAGIAAHVAASPVLAAKSERLRQLKGAGPVLAHTLLAYLPELGILPDKTVACLAGVVPHPKDSGTTCGKRKIQAGRGAVRKVLYMAAVSASHSNTVLKAFYQRLLQAGKPAKVALTAVMRKMITVLNKLLADPDFTLA
ncbi:IS110 family transposase [Luteolibacter sp. Populi]|uniref:IS110 family transposase n=1 Tax=Luteolibacter sp. Populi TaxID=3230487 RepID=UPI0034674B13